MRPTLVLFGAYSVLVMAWVVANPPSAAPDEGAHYVKAIALTRGDVLGPRVPPVGSSASKLERFNNQLARQVDMPARLAQGTFSCFMQLPDKTADCLNAPSGLPARGEIRDVNPLATYQPFVYLVPGVVARLSPTRNNALRLGRVAFALQALTLLGLGLWLLGGSRMDPLVMGGVVTAVTPMVVFVDSTLSSSAIEVSAGFAAAAAALRFSRPEPIPRAFWPVVGVIGVPLALSRPAGPAWVVLFALMAGSLLGGREARARLGAGGRSALVALSVIAVACAASAVWQVVVQPRSGATAGTVTDALYSALTLLPRWLNEQIGVFGLVDTPMPGFVYTLWTAMVVGLIAVATMVADRRARWTLAWTTIMGVLTLPLLFDAIVGVPVGGHAQGRWVLPFGVAVPLLAGELIARGRSALPVRKPERLLMPLACAAAATQLLAFWSMGLRYAVGVSGPDWFFTHARWSPPLGWTPWTVLVVIGAGGIVVAAWRAVHDPAWASRS